MKKTNPSSIHSTFPLKTSSQVKVIVKQVINQLIPPRQQLVPSSRQREETRKPVIKFPFPEVYTAMTSDETFSYADLCKMPQQEQVPCRKAMQDEINAMEEYKVWNLQFPPPNVKPISCKWIY
ncbi:hypothetical protein JTE90_028614 [Oedothorax gibbosus]|uniref:Uncharacterized protein n=1 Tax=Oedothorax gibbosus TaxID=931172 RepID=A0AAV6TX84_9ARAC|nr:hypothetical protein JTE90_028614 [Oedothorax gibbosus]